MLLLKLRFDRCDRCTTPDVLYTSYILCFICSIYTLEKEPEACCKNVIQYFPLNANFNNTNFLLR